MSRVPNIIRELFVVDPDEDSDYNDYNHDRGRVEETWCYFRVTKIVVSKGKR